MTLWPRSQRGRCVTLPCLYLTSTFISVITKILSLEPAVLTNVELLICLLLDSLVNMLTVIFNIEINE